MKTVIFDYSKLDGRITEKFKTRTAFAKAIGRSNSYMVKFFHNETHLEQWEIIKWAEALEISTEDIESYFFMPKVFTNEK